MRDGITPLSSLTPLSHSLISLPSSLIPTTQIIIKKATFVLGNPYVTDGLVAHFDGIWNAGLGRHDPAATEWTNLVSGNHTISSAAISFAPDALNIQSSVISINLNSDAAVKAISSGKFTIEIVGFIEAFTTTRFYWLADSTDQYGSPNISLMTHNISAMFILQKLSTIENVVSHGSDTAPCSAYGNIVVKQDDNTQYKALFYKDARLNTYRWFEESTSPKNLFINSFATGPVGKYHALRIYSRPLSETEITANYEIDKIRFHL